MSLPAKPVCQLCGDLSCTAQRHIPASEWVGFKLRGTEDSYVNGFYKEILSQWFASVGYVRNVLIPNIEVYPTDMSDDDFEWEIWIPISKKQ